MSFLFGEPKAPPPPPPPPAAPMLSQPSIAEQGAVERQRLGAAEGAGFSGTDVTGGSGAANPSTTANPTASKSLLGG